MLDRTQLPRSFSVRFRDTSYDFVVTNASDENKLVVNAARQAGDHRFMFGEGLHIDRHAGFFTFDDALQGDLHRHRPLSMKMTAIPAKVLGVVWRMTGGLLGLAPGRVALGTSSVAFGWNIVMLAIMIGILFVVINIGVYVILPLLAVAALCFLLDRFLLHPGWEEETTLFTKNIANNVRDLVEPTVEH